MTMNTVSEPSHAQITEICFAADHADEYAQHAREGRVNAIVREYRGASWELNELIDPLPRTRPEAHYHLMAILQTLRNRFDRVIASKLR